MYRAGVLSLDQMPKLGGEDGPRLPRPSAVISAWTQLREKRNEKPTDSKDSKATKGQANASQAKNWDRLSNTTARSWNFD
jgi:hypothetical protein